MFDGIGIKGKCMANVLKVSDSAEVVEVPANNGLQRSRPWMIAATNERVGDRLRNGAQVSSPGKPSHFDRRETNRDTQSKNQPVLLPALELGAGAVPR
jgi:hypothetical protein